MGPLAPALPYIMAATAVAGTGMAYESNRQQKSIADDATAASQRATSANIANIKAEGAETKRRQIAENTRLESIAEAKIGRTGFKQTGSLETFLSSIKEIGMKELDWLTKSTKSQADLASKGGAFQSITQMAKSRSAGADMTSSLVKGVGSLSNWWDKYGTQVSSDFGSA